MRVLLNSPWSFIAVIAVLLSFPRKVSFSKNPPAIIFYIKSFWWYRWLPGKTGIRAAALGNIVFTSTWADDRDLGHELIHVQQYMRKPFIQAFFYFFEMLQHGTKLENKYEKEAYEKSGSRYGNFVK